MTNKFSYSDGLRDAANLLQSTAQDYRQMERQKEREALTAKFTFPHEKATCIRLAASYAETARLLDGQAHHILELMHKP